jgi:phosphatidate cytidylyltransferase
MLRKRVMSALVIVPLFAAFAYIGAYAWAGFVLVFMLLAAWEYLRLLRGMGYHMNRPLLMSSVTLFLLAAAFPSSGLALGLVLTLVFLAGAIVAMVKYEQGYTQAYLAFALYLAGSVYLGHLGAYFIHLRALPQGHYWLLTALILVWLSDVGSFFVGSCWGKHKLMPRLSPQKSWEGYFGNLGSALLGSFLLAWLAARFNWLVPLWKFVLLGLVIGGITPFGDFFVSMIKRIAGVKDTGNLIPGHGGVLDRIDSWIWAVVLSYYCVVIFGF